MRYSLFKVFSDVKHAKETISIEKIEKIEEKNSAILGPSRGVVT
jgi:hypothetical protein